MFEIKLKRFEYHAYNINAGEPAMDIIKIFI